MLGNERAYLEELIVSTWQYAYRRQRDCVPGMRLRYIDTDTRNVKFKHTLRGISCMSAFVEAKLRYM